MDKPWYNCKSRPASGGEIPDGTHRGSSSPKLRGLNQFSPKARRVIRAPFWALFLLLAACGTSPDSISRCDSVPICPDSQASGTDLITLGQVTQAYLAVQGWVPCICAFFAYDLEAALAAGIPPSPKPGRTDGLCRGVAPAGRVVIRRYGDAEPFCESLLIHELAHHSGYSHPPQGTDPDREAMQAFEKEIREAM